MATPQVVRVDGSVFDASGVPVTAAKDIQIKAYDAASGGTLLWTSDVSNASVSAGRFTINMDAASGSSPSLVSQIGSRTTGQGIYFQIEVDSGAADGSMDLATVVLPRLRAKGGMFALSAAQADTLKGVSATSTELNYLMGATANVQTQINAISGGGAGSKVSKTGDSMSGALEVGAAITSTGTVTGQNVVVSAATPSRFAMIDSFRQVVSSANGVTDTEFGYLVGVTQNLQTQLNAKANPASHIYKIGDTMTGDLGLAGSQATPSRALILDSSRRVASSTVTDTELTFLSGVSASLTKVNAFTATEATYLSGATSNIGAKINKFTTAEAGYLAGTTAAIQTQILNRVLVNQQCSTDYYLRGFDSAGAPICVALPGNETFTGVATGIYTTCGLVSSEKVKCWGENSYGQLGNGTQTAGTLPVDVRTTDGDKLSTVAEITGGDMHFCARKTDGTVWCWGYNPYGGLGNGTTTDSWVAVQVSGVTSAIQMSAADYATCATLSDGKIKCWGYNGYGQLGDGTTNNSSSPVQVSGVTTAVRVAIGQSHSCAVLSTGVPKCWGYNGGGALGDGTTNDRYTPVTVSSLTGVTAISASRSHFANSHSCAVKTDGTAWCWGVNNNGQLGDGTTNSSPTRRQVSGITSAVEISLSNASSCARLSGGTIKCWGYNGYGNLGDGTATDQYTPVTVVGSSGTGTLSGVTKLSSNDGVGGNANYACAVASGKIYCWGHNANGQFGNNSTTSSYSPKATWGP